MGGAEEQRWGRTKGKRRQQKGEKPRSMWGSIASKIPNNKNGFRNRHTLFQLEP